MASTTRVQERTVHAIALLKTPPEAVPVGTCYVLKSTSERSGTMPIMVIFFSVYPTPSAVRDVLQQHRHPLYPTQDPYPSTYQTRSVIPAEISISMHLSNPGMYPGCTLTTTKRSLSAPAPGAVITPTDCDRQTVIHKALAPSAIARPGSHYSRPSAASWHPLPTLRGVLRRARYPGH